MATSRPLLNSFAYVNYHLRVSWPNFHGEAFACTIYECSFLNPLKPTRKQLVEKLGNNILLLEWLSLTNPVAIHISGPISMITSTSLQVLNLSSNEISGDLPLLTGKCALLDLSKNRFTGNLSWLVKWGNAIELLDLSQNQLTGPIPDVTSQFLRLTFLNLSHNSFSNSLPTVLTQFPKLKILDLSFNQIGGTLLDELLILPTLQELHLTNNILSGDIKFISLHNQSNLRVLDLSHNHFNGNFPEEFSSLTGLQVLDLAGNSLSGSLPSSLTVISSLVSLDLSQNLFAGSLPANMQTTTLQNFNVSFNNFSGIVPENLRKFPYSSFFPGNLGLQLPSPPPGSGNFPSGDNPTRKPIRTGIKVVVIVVSVVAAIILILLAICIHYCRLSRRSTQKNGTRKDISGMHQPKPTTFSGRQSSSALVVSADDLMATRKVSLSEVICTEEKIAAATSFSPSKHNQLLWSPDSGDSFTPENLARLDVGSPDQLAGELHFLDDMIRLTPEDLSRAPAEVLGRSSHGTSYKATLDSGVVLTVKWLREGVAKQKKEFSKEAKNFANIRHPNVVGLRGYYWGPTQHEKLILSEFISPGSLASFLYGKISLALIVPYLLLFYVTRTRHL
ncbi:hypothetical protein GIB67_031662 [Kingdonia uniflora]|uniref:Protein kinase domain-containing protein n=1 Tax=Kingdonia uniflora TaxID=39325 RepID=A0A7J7NJM6_9MAGN|nr:hypothetical protein GIB67_031662 [Kingdonia uniflora]